MSGVACHHRLWKAQTVERRRAWLAIIALRQHKWSNDIRRGMTSPPLDNTHGRPTSGMACHHRLWAAHTVKRRQAWHNITALGQYTRSTTYGVAYHHRPWAAHAVRLRWEWHDITALGQNTLSNDVRRCMPSSPLDSTHGRTTSGVACHHRLYDAHMVR